MLVSVIIPVYNVEKYIAECLNSVIKQTHKELQIIIVNDGSTDNSKKIVDTFIDSRIVLIDQVNGGLSHARNSGIEKIEGVYVVFVDSDDYLHPDCIKKMVQAAETNLADIVQTNYYYMWSSGQKVLATGLKENQSCLMGNHQMIKELIHNQYIKNFAWGKLYRADLIKNITFPAGKLFEDVFWQHQVMHRANLLLYLNDPLYYYRQRTGSIVNTYTLKHLDYLEGLEERSKFMYEHYNELYPLQAEETVKMHLIHYKLVIKKVYRKDWRIAARKIRATLNSEKLKSVQINNQETLSSRQLFDIHPSIYISDQALKALFRRIGKRNNNSSRSDVINSVTSR
ncbi:glycosyltransferase family 2 protein [Bacillus daqingensis]|uniref:Glycosyltransferase family 2 protein n=1 Tax=Bacillus daqingensis TaxID=872396 RepID=A0ABV9NPT6_9BACI